jgi:hypothetical protein
VLLTIIMYFSRKINWVDHDKNMAVIDENIEGAVA